MMTLAPFQAKLTAIRTCPVCEVDVPHKQVWKKWGYPILQCKACGLGSTDAAGFDPQSYYTADYFTGGHRDGYGDYTGSRDVLKAEFRSTLAQMRRSGFKNGRVLELGSAYGYFLEVLSENDLDGTGLEICADAVKECQARGLKAHAGILDEAFLHAHGTFDALVMLDVVEHLPNPAEVFSRIHRAIKPGGMLVMSTGNWSSLVSSITRSHWRLMTPPQHLFFYSKHTLSRLAANHGFRTVSLRSPWKKVPLGLMGYQITRRLGLPIKLPRWMHHVGLPVNLFDAMRLVAVREQA
jgi:SAM-dependent methyltransferase